MTFSPPSNSCLTLKPVAGPQEDEWESHKQTIIDLYRNRTMPYLRKEMKSRFGFDASKRMYETRLHKWGVCKNMKSAEKESLLKLIESQRGNELQLSKNKLSKLRRWQKDKEKRLRDVTRDNVASYDAPYQTRPSDRVTVRSDNLGVLSGRYSRLFTTPSDSPDTQNSIQILHYVRECCDNQIKYGVDLGLFKNLNSHLLDSPRTFWDNIEYNIYFVKTRHATKLQMQPSKITDASVRQSLRCDLFEFVWELFNVLSPINTRLCVEFRQLTLRYLYSLAADELHPAHPVTMLCGLLLHNTQSYEVSEVALLQAWDSFGKRLGYEHPAACRLQRSLADTARRARSLDEAERRARALYNHICKPRIDSYLARWCASSLAHVLLDMKKHDEAREVLLSIVLSTSLLKDPALYDERATRAAEDLAHLELEIGKVEVSYWYLERACVAGRRLYPGSVHHGFLKEKLRSGVYANCVPSI